MRPDQPDILRLGPVAKDQSRARTVLPAAATVVVTLIIGGGLGLVGSGALNSPPLGVVPIESRCQLTSDFSPDSSCTPGVVATKDRALICKVGYSESVRYVPRAVRTKVLASYGLLSPDFNGVLDHRVPISLGGAVADPRNLAPTIAYGPRGNRAKSTVEQRVRRAFCEGRITIEDAQDRFKVRDPNWELADDDLLVLVP